MLAGWTWTWTLLGVLACAGGGSLYLRRMRPSAERAAAFLAGLAVLLLALASPLAALAARALFSAHMLQMLLLALGAAPLLVLGLPRTPRWASSQLARALTQPVVAWILGVGTLALWAIPALADATVTRTSLQVVQALSLLGASMAFWWPICGPVPAAQRIGPGAAIVYLFLASVAEGGLGALVTVAPPGLYPAYAQPPDGGHVLALLHRAWGMSGAADDQQLGGGILWVGNVPTLVVACLVELARWYNAPDQTLTEGETQADPAF